MLSSVIAALDSKPKHVEKVLDVQQGEIAYLVGTVYMEMKLKPNILDDITKDHWIAAQPDRPKYTDDSDSVYLEDESGRVKLVGPKISGDFFVTGTGEEYGLIVDCGIGWDQWD